MRYTEIAVKCKEDLSEIITEVLYENGAKGVSIEGDIDYEALQSSEIFWDYIDENLIANRSNEVTIKTYFSEEEFKNSDELIEKLYTEIHKLKDFGFNTDDVNISADLIDEKDWANNWKQYYKPLKITDSIVIQPEWEDYTPNPGEHVILIDPGMAFGTGSHETTSMCIKAIDKYHTGIENMLDIGCGSGILSMAGVKLGVKNALGIDLDPVAVKVAKENVELNNLQNQITIKHGNLADDCTGQYDMVVANIMADVIIILCNDVNKFLKKGSYFITSGIIKAKLNDVLNAIKNIGLDIVEINEDGEWCAIVAQKK